MRARLRSPTLLALVITGLVGLPAHSLAATGDLTVAGCISKAALAGCNTNGGGALQGATAVAVSPDGTSVYVASYSDDSISVFNRAANGALTGAGCISKTAIAGCTTTGGDALGGATGVAVSPDGTSVYVTAYSDQAVSTFDRAANGALTRSGCISKGAIAGCTTTGSGALGSATGVAVSPDGTSVYVTGYSDDAVSTFDRAANGALTRSGCISKAALSGCNTNGGGALDGAEEVAVSPDGTSVYVPAGNDNAVSSFNRAANGALTGAGCISKAALAGCTTPGGGVALTNAFGVAVSPEGTSVYVTALDDDGISVFNRAANGALTSAGCITKAALAGCNTNGGGALDYPVGVAVSPDGMSVYVTAGVDDAISTFSRAANGALTGTGCISRAALDGCTVPAGGSALNGANSVAVSPDGTSVYLTANSDYAISTFSREVPPAPVPTTSVSAPTGRRAAALAKCKKRARRHHWSHKRLRRCKKQANLLPV